MDNYLKRIVILVGMYMLIFGAKATTGENAMIGDMKYILWDNGTASLYKAPEDMVEVDIPEKVVFENDTYIVTDIYTEAFSGCASLTSVKIPKTISSIQQYAFKECTALTKAEFSSIESLCRICFQSHDANPLFYAHNLYINGEEVKDLVIPNSINSIKDYTFLGCTGLTSVKFHESLTSIGSYAFAYCAGLTSVTLPENMNFKVNEDLSTTNSDESYGIFYGCTGLTTVNLPKNITAIPHNMFEGCTSLKSIDIPESTTIIGSRAFSGCSALESINIPDSVKTIFPFAFSQCTSLTSVSIPNSVISNYWGIFRDCTELNSVTLPESMTAISDYMFANCTSLTSIEFPQSVTTVCVGAFFGCESLTNISLPASVSAIGDGGFYNCNSLNLINIEGDNLPIIKANTFGEVSYESGLVLVNSKALRGFDQNWASFKNLKEKETMQEVKLYDDGVFSYVYFPENINANLMNVKDKSAHTELTVPDKINIENKTYNVSSITVSAFEDCENLKSITIPEGIESIGYNAFNNCENLTKAEFASIESFCSIQFNYAYSNPLYFAHKLYIGGREVTNLTIPNSITSIGEYSFTGANEIASIKLPETIKYIGMGAFYDCTGLNSINIPNAVTSIGEYAFYGCSNLNSIDIPNSVISIGESAFSDCSALKSVTLPNNIKLIDNFTFLNCTSLESIEIPESVTRIEYAAFGYDSALSSISIPNSVTYIGAQAFDTCSALTSLTIPESVKHIGNYAFVRCSGLKSIFIPGSNTMFENETFNNCTGLQSVTVKNINSWARNIFQSNGANPLYYAKNLYVGEGENPVRNIVIEGEEPIGNYSFAGSNCRKVRVKDGAPIGEGAFYECSELTDVCLNSSYIDSEAFLYSPAIQNVYVPLETPPTTNIYVFDDEVYKTANLYVPYNVILDYKNSSFCWWQFSNILESDFANIETMFAPDYDNGTSRIETIDYNSDESYGDSASHNVFTLQGVCVKRNAGVDDLKTLKKGLYIIDGKKVVVK